jgi:hypothetical protein
LIKNWIYKKLKQHSFFTILQKKNHHLVKIHPKEKKYKMSSMGIKVSKNLLSDLVTNVLLVGFKTQ